ncbi:hypothetical protein J1N35_029157 [Gossypium stocksii]|uniref:Uncharacterized protein n=1 Tax=Gossypium stocksii TaxID=47602 RepID=A0A9D3UXC7_9ROSI|nr:hypothetical protein J1N35_029157 [Gossypium stocksii]
MDLESSPMTCWKQKLLGVGSADFVEDHMAIGSNNDGDQVLLEGDVIRSIVNGIPTIDFFDRIK